MVKRLDRVLQYLAYNWTRVLVRDGANDVVTLMDVGTKVETKERDVIARTTNDDFNIRYAYLIIHDSLHTMVATDCR